MRVLLHHLGAGKPPVGMWWLPKHRSAPQSEYLDSNYYTRGAFLVLGQGWKQGDVLSLAQWENRADRLAESANPLSVFTVHETDDPGQLFADQLDATSRKTTDTASEAKTGDS